MSEVWSKAKYILLVLIVGFVIFRLVEEFKNIDIKKSIILFKEIPTMEFIIIVVLGILAILVLSLYDVVLKRTLHIDISYQRLIPFSFITNAMNNILGFGGLFGSGLRYYFYKDKTEDTRLLKAISLMLVSLVTGLGFLSLLVTFKVFDAGGFATNFKYTQILIYGMAFLFVVFIVYTTARPLSEKTRFFGMKLALVSIIDWFFASGILYVILRVLNVEVPYGLFLAVFTIAAVVGLLSMIPGGFGAFDLVILSGLSSFGVTSETLVLALLLYRMSYYFIPFVFALVLAIGEFKLTVESYLKDQDDKSPFTTSMVRDLFTYMPSLITGVLTGITGITYMLGHVLILYNMIFFKTEQGFYLLLVINIAACFIMVASSLGVASSSRRAYLMALFASIMLIVTTMLSYGTLLSAVWLVTLSVILLFGYHSAVTLQRSFRPTRFLITTTLFLAMMYYNFLVSDFIFDFHKNSMILKTELFFSVVVLVLLISFLGYGIMSLQVHKEYLKINRKIKDETITHIINTYGGGFLSHLAYSKDKHFYVNDNKTAFIMYKKVRNTIIVLGDPIGAEEDFTLLLETFYDKMIYIGYDIVFYQVQDKNLSLYHEFGNVFFKLGEEALIPLDTFTLHGKKQRAFRSTMNRFEKEGYTFKVIHPPFFEADILACRTVSEEWLENRKEMHFSVGKFDTYYLKKAPIGIIKNKEDKVVAFTSFMPVNDTILSVDLIRWNRGEALSMMDALYLNMLVYAKEEGYAYFNMGMATLSNVGQNKYGYLREKIAGVVFEKMRDTYDFSGLRYYKAKFKPEWEDRYLIYRKYSSVLVNVLRVIFAIRKA